jgi:hypothetical protein
MDEKICKLKLKRRIIKMNKENSYTNYSLLCKVQKEADKIYYWNNMEKLFPLLDAFLQNWEEVKILSHQHFDKIKWDKKINANRSSSSAAPTGGSNNKWNYETLKKVMTLYLEDKTYHNYIFDRKNEEIKIPSVHKKGYPFHYSTEIFGRIKKVKHDPSGVIEQTPMDFRLKIPYCFSHDHYNMYVDISFNEAIFSKEEMNTLVSKIVPIVFAKKIFVNENIKGMHYYVSTYEDMKVYFKEEEHLWREIIYK